MPRNGVKLLLAYFTIYYFAQGVYNAYASFEQAYLRSNGVSLTDVAVSKSVAKIPWSVKVLMAIPTDWIGRRLPFATVGMIAGATCLAIISSFNPGGSNYPTYVATVFLRNVGIAFSDVAVDGMSVDCGLDAMAGTVQGFMSAGRVTGTLLGAGVGAPIVGNGGYGAVIMFLSSLIFCAVPINCFMREERPQKSKDQGSSSGKGSGSNNASMAFEWSAFKELLRKPVLCFLAYACIGNFSGVLGGTASTEWAMTVVQPPLAADDLGYLTVVGSVGDMVGAVGTGWMFDRYDRRFIMAASAVLGCITNLVVVWTTTRTGWFALGFFSGVASGSLFVSNSGTVMTLADTRVGASVFAIAVSLMNFSQLAADAIGGPLAEKSLVAAFWASFAGNLLQLPFVPYITPPPKRATGGEGGMTPASPGAGGNSKDGDGDGTALVHGQALEWGATTPTAVQAGSRAAYGRDAVGKDSPVVVMNALHQPQAAVHGLGGQAGYTAPGQHIPNPYSQGLASAQASNSGVSNTTSAGSQRPADEELEKTAAEALSHRLSSLVNQAAAMSSSKYAPVAPGDGRPSSSASARDLTRAARRLEQLQKLQAATAQAQAHAQAQWQEAMAAHQAAQAQGQVASWDGMAEDAQVPVAEAQCLPQSNVAAQHHQPQLHGLQAGHDDHGYDHGHGHRMPFAGRGAVVGHMLAVAEQQHAREP